HMIPSYSGMPSDVGYEGDDFPGHGGGGYHYPQFKKYLERRGLSFQVVNKDERGPHGHHTCCGEVVSPLESTNEYFLVESAIALMKRLRKGGQPFCLQLHFWGPHEPFLAPAEFLNLYRNVSIPPWPNFKEDRVDRPGFHDVFRRPDKAWSFW